MKAKTVITLAPSLFVAAGVMITAQPAINSVSDTPNLVKAPGYNTITANITNSTSAYAEIIYPNATPMGNFSMTQVVATTMWYYNHTYSYPGLLRTYSYIAKAHNATGWPKSTMDNFVIQDITASLLVTILGL